MEEKIVYFEKPGKENTADVIKLVLEDLGNMDLVSGGRTDP